MPKQDDIRIRRGTQADIEAMPVGNRLSLGEPAYSIDTYQLFIGTGVDDPVQELSGRFKKQATDGYTGGDVRGAPQAGATNFIDICSNKANSPFVNDPLIPRAGQNSICVSVTAAGIATGDNSMVICPMSPSSGIATASALSSWVIGTGTISSSASNSKIIGNAGLNVTVDSVFIIGERGTTMRGQNGGIAASAKRMWCWTVQDRSTPFAAHSDTNYGTCPKVSIPFDPGLTLYLFPKNRSLADWETYRILLTELTTPNTGMYEADLSLFDQSTDYVLFIGSAQPSWPDNEGTYSFSELRLELLQYQTGII
jgi:hypothetical protein